MGNGSGERIITGLTVRYVLVLVALTGLAVGSYFLLEQVIAGNESGATLVNVGGRQRMLSQRVTLLAERLAEDILPANRQTGREQLKRSIELMERSLGALVKGDPGMNVPAAMSEETRALYFGPKGFADRRTRAFLEQAKAFAAAAARDQRPDNPHLLYLLEAAPGGLLDSLDAVVSQYQRESERRVADLRAMQGYVLALTLVVLALSAFAVFRPIRRNIAERQATENALRSANERLSRQAAKLKEANETLADYAYAVSHDLKAPLRAIRNYGDFLIEDLEGVLQDNQRIYLDGLKKALQEADNLIDDLLTYGQMGADDIPFETIEPENFIREVVDGLSPPETAEVTMAEGWPVIDTSPVLFKQIILNLVANALKFGPAGEQRVEICFQPGDDRRLEISVRDNGIGIDERFHERVFHVFKRLHTKSEYEGTGIGLAIVKKAAARLGGRAWVESKPGAGSTFTVSLPLKQEEQPDER